MYPFEGAAHVSASLRAGLLFRSLQFRWLFNGSGSLFSLVCIPLRVLHMFQPLSALVFFAAICNSVDELMSVVHSALHCRSLQCRWLVDERGS